MGSLLKGTTTGVAEVLICVILFATTGEGSVTVSRAHVCLSRNHQLDVSTSNLIGKI